MIAWLLLFIFLETPDLLLTLLREDFAFLFGALLLLGFFFNATLFLGFLRTTVFLLCFTPVFTLCRFTVLLRGCLAAVLVPALALRRRVEVARVAIAPFFLRLVAFLRVIGFAAVARLLRRFAVAGFFLTGIKFSLRIYNLPELAYPKKPNTSISKILRHSNHF